MKYPAPVLIALALAASACSGGYPITCDPPRHEIVVQGLDGWPRHECVLDPPAAQPPAPAPTPTPTHPTVWV